MPLKAGRSENFLQYHRHCQKISPDFWAWLAGFTDGEGSIGLGIYRKLNRYAPRLTIVNTNRSVLEEIQRELGGSIDHRQLKIHWKPSFRWTLQYTKAVCCLEFLLPHLRIKQIQALAVITLEAAKDAFANYAGKKRGVYKYSAQDIAAFEWLHREVKKLNQKGVTSAD